MTDFSFHTVRDAKEFLAGKIAEEAEREGAPLSEIERKMLLHSEIGRASAADVELNEEFDRIYDQGEYETKITRLIRNAVRRARKENPNEYQQWHCAVRKLSKGDHYILVMTRRAGLKDSSSSFWPFRTWRARLLALAACVSIFVLLYFLNIYVGLGGRQAPYAKSPAAARIFGYLMLVGGICGYFVALVIDFDKQHVITTSAQRVARQCLAIFKRSNS
jgi:hypothetical protein